MENRNTKNGLEPGTPVTVGMPATVSPWTDCYPCTVSFVSESGRTIRVRVDHAVRTDSYGMSDVQEYEYSRDPDGTEYTFTLRKNGRYVQKGSRSGNGYLLTLGHRRAYHDFSF